jgi:hypothetical protein
MNDRDLLEAAAKAAGIDVKKFVEQVTDYDSPHYGIHAIQLDSTWNTWNPLEDDGDALRLAVELRLSIDLAGRMTKTETPSGDLFGELHHGDPRAATRRAIVHAAAFLSKGKHEP